MARPSKYPWPEIFDHLRGPGTWQTACERWSVPAPTMRGRIRREGLKPGGGLLSGPTPASTEATARPSTPSAAEWVPIDSVTPWEKNPRLNADAVAQVAKSISRFGWGSPIIAREADRVLIAGHTRLKAAKSLGMDKVLVRFLDLDPAQAAALALADNKLGEIADWDDEGLAEVLRELEADSVDLDGLGWDDKELAALLSEEGTAAPEGFDDETYSLEIKAPVYEPKGQRPEVSALFDPAKENELVADIDAADLPEEVADFLRRAAQRHTSFHFRNIAEYYCHAPPEVQALMERSALVIIDFKAAIENGFVSLTDRLGELADKEAADAG